MPSIAMLRGSRRLLRGLLTMREMEGWTIMEIARAAEDWATLDIVRGLGGWTTRDIMWTAKGWTTNGANGPTSRRAQPRVGASSISPCAPFSPREKVARRDG